MPVVARLAGADFMIACYQLQEIRLSYAARDSCVILSFFA